ncbi:MAG: hypothetical protein JRF63_12385 [Deltaproteobacteria bacterium]|nr:hypothetical protein [Deltaproteobacteria bacterium]
MFNRKVEVLTTIVMLGLCFGGCGGSRGDDQLVVSGDGPPGDPVTVVDVAEDARRSLPS